MADARFTQDQAGEPLPALEPCGARPGDIRSVSFYIGADSLVRARAAYEATSWLEGDRSWSHFVEKALQAETSRREARFNESRPFDGGEGPLKPGRPTIGSQLRAAQMSDAASDDPSPTPP